MDERSHQTVFQNRGWLFAPPCNSSHLSLPVPWVVRLLIQYNTCDRAAKPSQFSPVCYLQRCEFILVCEAPILVGAKSHKNSQPGSPLLVFWVFVTYDVHILSTFSPYALAAVTELLDWTPNLSKAPSVSLSRKIYINYRAEQTFVW